MRWLLYCRFARFDIHLGYVFVGEAGVRIFLPPAKGGDCWKKDCFLRAYLDACGGFLAM